MRQILLDEALEIQRKLIEKEEQGIIGIHSWGIQLRANEFLKLFDKYEIEYNAERLYPFELSAVYKGTKAFSLLGEKEATQYEIQIPEQNL